VLVGAASRLSFDLAVMYHNGTGLENDEKQSLTLLEKAAENGSPNAQYNPGLIHENGMDASKDDAFSKLCNSLLHKPRAGKESGAAVRRTEPVIISC